MEPSGLFVYGSVLSSPLGRMRALPGDSNVTYREIYQGPEIDVPGAVERAHERTREILERILALMARAPDSPVSTRP